MNCTQQTDSFITGERGGGEGGVWRQGAGIQKGLREMSKRRRERGEGGRGGRREVGGIGSRWKEDERKESVLGEASGRKR